MKNIVRWKEGSVGKRKMHVGTEGVFFFPPGLKHPSLYHLEKACFRIIRHLYFNMNLDLQMCGLAMLF